VYTLYTIFIVLGMIVALVFSALVFLTGKGDAMSGGGGVRTTFKGKASFDDFMSRLTLYLGIGFMALMLIIDILGHQAVTVAPK
jgi:protein translocase SecG subunit